MYPTSIVDLHSVGNSYTISSEYTAAQVSAQTSESPHLKEQKQVVKQPLLLPLATSLLLTSYQRRRITLDYIGWTMYTSIPLVSILLVGSFATTSAHQVRPFRRAISTGAAQSNAREVLVSSGVESLGVTQRAGRERDVSAALSTDGLVPPAASSIAVVAAVQITQASVLASVASTIDAPTDTPSTAVVAPVTAATRESRPTVTQATNTVVLETTPAVVSSIPSQVVVPSVSLLTRVAPTTGSTMLIPVPSTIATISTAASSTVVSTASRPPSSTPTPSFVTSLRTASIQSRTTTTIIPTSTAVPVLAADTTSHPSASRVTFLTVGVILGGSLLLVIIFTALRKLVFAKKSARWDERTAAPETWSGGHSLGEMGERRRSWVSLGGASMTGVGTGGAGSMRSESLRSEIRGRDEFVPAYDYHSHSTHQRY